MYDTKTRELRWNATYSDYSAPLYEESYPYSECPWPCPHWLCRGAAAAGTWAAMAAGECSCCAMLCSVVLGLTCLAVMEPWLWDGQRVFLWHRQSPRPIAVPCRTPVELWDALGLPKPTVRGWQRDAATQAAPPHCLPLCVHPEMSHFASSGDGLVVTLDKESGEVLWAQNYGSPVVGIYVWHQDSLRRIPHLNLAMETLRYLTFHSQDIHLARWGHQSMKDFTATKTQLL